METKHNLKNQWVNEEITRDKKMLKRQINIKAQHTPKFMGGAANAGPRGKFIVADAQIKKEGRPPIST